MSGGIHANRWMNYLGDILRVLRPGGWCQMVEIYFNAQSDNGTLTSSEWSSKNQVGPQDADARNRPRTSGVVTKLYGKHTARKGPQGAVAAAKLDDAGWFRGSRVAIVDFAPERVVHKYEALGCTCGRLSESNVLTPRQMPETKPSARRTEPTSTGSCLRLPYFPLHKPSSE